MAFRSLSSSRDLTSAFIWFTSSFSLATSWADLAFIRRDANQAETGADTIAMMARTISFIPENISLTVLSRWTGAIPGH